MADIARYPFVRHLRGAPTVHVRHMRRGTVVHDGPGLSFWFRPLSAVLSELPIDDREVQLLFHARTADFQDVSVQMSVSYRLSEPARAAERLDFSIDPDTGTWRGAPLDQIAGLLTETAQQHALGLLARMPLIDALTEGVNAVRLRATDGLGNDARLAQIGLTVIDVRVVAIRPQPEVEKALQTPTRERVQQDADRATFERRAVAVERERAIGENELQTQIELARREEQLVGQRGANARRKAEEEAASAKISNDAWVARERLVKDTNAASIKAVGAAEVEVETARLLAYGELDQGVLLGLALKDLAANLPKIDSLVLTPDLLAPILARLGGQAQRPAAV